MIHDDDDFDFAGFDSADYEDDRPPRKENPLLPRGEYEMVCVDIDADPDKDYQKWTWEIVAGEHEGQELVFFERPQSDHDITRKIARQHIAQMVRAVNAGENKVIRDETDLLDIKVLVGLKHSKKKPDYPQRLEVSYITAIIEDEPEAKPARRSTSAAKASVARSAAKGAESAAKRERADRGRQRSRQAPARSRSRPMDPPPDDDGEDFDDDLPF